MTYNTIKNQYNANVVQAAELKPWRCKFTDSVYVGYGSISVATPVDSSETDTQITISGGEASRFTSSSYLLWDDEILRVAVVSDTQLSIVARAQFGTVGAAHSAGPAQIKHSGEVDGSCFGNPETCSDPNAYDGDFQYSLIFPSQTITEDFQAWSGLASIRYSDAEVDPGETIGKRGKATVVIRDSIDDSGSWDAVTVPYSDRRTARATRFSKLMARCLYLENREITLWNGFLDGGRVEQENLQKYEFIIDDVSVKRSSNGYEYTLSCLDPFILVEDKKSKAPVESKGTLATAIDSSSTSFTVANIIDFEYGQLNEEVVIRFDSEVILCTVTGANTFDIDQRAFKQISTSVSDHEVNTTAQLCIRYQNIHVVDIIADLIRNYSSMPDRYIGDYSDTISLTPTLIISDVVLTKPKAVKELINELIKIGDLVVWFDRFRNSIEIKVNPEFATTTIAFNEESNIEIDSFSFDRDLDIQYTRAPVYWGRIDATKDSGEEYFAISSNIVNADLELPDGLGETNERKEIFLPWLNNSLDDNQLGAALSNRISSRNPLPPIEATFNVDGSEVGERADGQRLELGTILNVQSSEIVNPDGTVSSELYQVLRIQQLDYQLYSVKARRYQIPVNSNEFDFIISSSAEDYDLSTEFAPQDAGTYSVLIQAGVVIGQVSALYAMTTGSQAHGVELRIVNRGRILGKGGNGGSGGQVTVEFEVPIDSDPGAPGRRGGDALNITVPTTIDNGGGFIFGGGGGAAGSQSFADFNGIFDAGNGGSGGQGYIGGAGAPGGYATRIGSQPPIDEGLRGMDGSINAPGTLGAVSGGSFGEAGSNFNAGGSGFGVVTNGNSIVFVSGNSQLNLKGGIE